MELPDVWRNARPRRGSRMMPYQYFSHEIDAETNFCTGCGRFLTDLQENRRWVGGEVFPRCVEASNVAAISHIVRSPSRHDRR